jgi:acetylglutamate kinase
MCVVHGGGHEVTRLQKSLGRNVEFVGGRRVTTRDDLDLLRMVLSGAINKRLASDFNAAGIPAIGLSGEDGRLIEAEVLDAALLGYSGRPRKVNALLLHTLMDAGFLPVISPVSRDLASGGPLNVNGDDAAAAIAVAVGASELLLVADVAGVRGGNGDFLAELTCDAAQELVEGGIAVDGMSAKLESAQTALLAGVDRVRIVDLAGLVDQSRGTSITQSQSVLS